MNTLWKMIVIFLNAFWFLFVVCLAMKDIGKAYSGVYSWDTPIWVFIFMVSNYILGIITYKNLKDE